jgi:hypothetical protein
MGVRAVKSDSYNLLVVPPGYLVLSGRGDFRQCRRRRRVSHGETRMGRAGGRMDHERGWAGREEARTGATERVSGGANIEWGFAEMQCVCDS